MLKQTDMIILLTAIVSLVTAIVGLVTVIVTTLHRRKGKWKNAG